MSRVLLGAACLIGAGLVPAAAAAQSLAQEGRAIAERNCGACHALEKTGDSAHPQAPPLRTFAARWPLEQLEESLAEGMVTGHADMPELSFEPDEISALLAYFAEVGGE